MISVREVRGCPGAPGKSSLVGQPRFTTAQGSVSVLTGLSRLLLPLLQASERRLRPIPQKQRTLHEKILEEIKQERKLRPVEMRQQGQKGTTPAGSM